MNKFSILIVAILFAGCSSDKKSDKTTTSELDISYSIDTVLVDAGDHLFFVQYGLGLSNVDTKNNLLYNYNPDQFTIEVIDLDKLEFKEEENYEKEGPNGIGGGYTFRIQKLDDGSTYFYDYMGIHHISAAGEKIESYRFNQDSFSGDSLAGNEEIEIHSLVTQDGNSFYGFYGEQTYDGETHGLTVIDIGNQTIKLFPTDFLDFTYAFDISFEQNGNGLAKYPERNNVHIHKGLVLITSSAKNEIWTYDPKTDSLTSKTYESQLTSNTKKGQFPRMTGSNEEWSTASKEKGKEVNFGGLIFDPQTSIFWRFSKEMDRLTASDSVVYKTVLTAFDEDLNQLGEKQLPTDYASNLRPFLLDGQFWEFLNVDDEVAFIRLKPAISFN